jgi:hypothetical protein
MPNGVVAPGYTCPWPAVPKKGSTNFVYFCAVAAAAARIRMEKRMDRFIMENFTLAEIID